MVQLDGKGNLFLNLWLFVSSFEYEDFEFSTMGLLRTGLSEWAQFHRMVLSSIPLLGI